MKDLQAERPVDRCDQCDGEVYHEECMYKWEERWVCLDCFKSNVESLLDINPRLLAEELMLDMREV